MNTLPHQRDMLSNVVFGRWLDKQCAGSIAPGEYAQLAKKILDDIDRFDLSVSESRRELLVRFGLWNVQNNGLNPNGELDIVVDALKKLHQMLEDVAQRQMQGTWNPETYPRPRLTFALKAHPYNLLKYYETEETKNNVEYLCTLLTFIAGWI